MALYRCPSCGQVNYRYICDYCGVDCVPYGEISEENEKTTKTEKPAYAYDAEKPIKYEKADSTQCAEKPTRYAEMTSTQSVEKPDMTLHWRKIGISSEKGRLPWEFKAAVIIMLCFVVIVTVCSIFEECSQTEKTTPSAYEHHEEATERAVEEISKKGE